MSTLARFGLTKEAMERMVGVVKPFKDPNPRIERRWLAIPDEIKTAILKEHHTYTLRELAKKYKISISCVWYIRKNSQTKTKTKKR
jgi:hypothetical protein